jgi:hypothetical protein
MYLFTFSFPKFKNLGNKKTFFPKGQNLCLEKNWVDMHICSCINIHSISVFSSISRNRHSKSRFNHRLKEDSSVYIWGRQGSMEKIGMWDREKGKRIWKKLSLDSHKCWVYSHLHDMQSHSCIFKQKLCLLHNQTEPQAV